MLTIEQKQQLAVPILNGLRSIGYRPGLVQRDYRYTDLFSEQATVRRVDVAAFGQEPFDYRSACLGIRVAQRPVDDPEELDDVRSLGAPYVLLVTPSITQQWQIGERLSVCTNVFPTREVEKRILFNKDYWSPSAVLRAKSGFAKPSPTQIDFVDVGLLTVLDIEAGKKIDAMVSRVLHRAELISKQCNEAFDPYEIFNILFRFLAAKLLKDRDFKTEPAIDFLNPGDTLRAVDNHYHSKKHRVHPAVSEAVLASIASETAASFSFRNISVDTLTYVYENTFVSPTSRRALGIHSTPSYVADYVLSQVPLEELPREHWLFLDPTCGHGIFLIAAMRRMRQLLPTDWGSQRRHQFFVEHLRGVDIEAFSIEVARLCLMLADFPEPNGWNLTCEDVFSKGAIERTGESVSILVGNPPFENLPKVTPHKPAPAELLDRSLPLIRPGGFIGLVLPKSFQDSVDYGKQRAQLLKDYDIISLTSLPDKIFIHSEAETVLLVAKKRAKSKITKAVTYRVVNEAETNAFAARQQVSWEDQVPQTYFDNAPGRQLVVPALRTVWEYLQNNPRLSQIADIRKGVEYDTKKLDGKYDNAVFDDRRINTAPGVHTSTPALTQYVLFKQQYFDLNPDLKRREAWNYEWDKPKVIAPAARHSRGPWRYAAIVDIDGLLASRLHYAFWPTNPELPVEVIAAILNSPVGAAYAFSHGSQKTVAKRTYQSIPLPPLNALKAMARPIQALVQKYMELILKPLRDDGECLDALLRIDALVLKLYDLPPKSERQLLDLFWGAERRVPFTFGGYVPPENKSWIPFWMCLEPAYKQSTLAALWDRLPEQASAQALKILQNIGTEGHD